MKLPLSVQQNTGEFECPFYCKDSLGNFGCAIKEITSETIWKNIVSNTSNSDYAKDCEGQFDNCYFVDLLWNENNNTPPTEPKNNTKENLEENTVDIKVSVNKVENPYKVISDVLIYPTNNLLEIDDPLLNRMSRNRIQEECDQYKTNVKMGSVYLTSNGHNNINGVVPKEIYHAVVAGESRLVNDADIKASIMKALMLADSNGHKIVSMLPADCGTHDVEQTAYVQLSAIQEFLTSVGVENLEYIFVIMDDQDSYDVFIDVFSTIFS